VLLSGDDHVEVGSSLRSAAAFGLREMYLDDRSAGWFDGPPWLRRESRAAARRHKNPLHVRRASPDLAAGLEEVVVVSPAGPGRAITRQPLARGRRQLVVIGAGQEQVAALPSGRLRVASLGPRDLGCAPPLRLVASIALAEIARQVGRPPPGRRRRRQAARSRARALTDSDAPPARSDRGPGWSRRVSTRPGSSWCRGR
jgi:hypothetical protein